MALILRDAKIINELDKGNIHDTPSMELIRKIVGNFEELIEAERNARIAVDNALQAALNTEKAERIAADNAERDARINAINTEKSERVAADNALRSAINTERTERIAADNALQAAINAEKAAREADVTNINNRIDSLTFGDIAGMLPGSRVWAGV